MAAGVPAERRFYRAKLTREGEGCRTRAILWETPSEGTHRFLAKPAVQQSNLHESNQEREKAREAMPRVWRSMLARPDDMLRDLLMEQVASECGTMPEQDDVESFLKACLSDEVPEVPCAPAPATKSRPRKSSPEPQPAASRATGRITGYTFENRAEETGAAYRTLAEVLKEFHQRDPQFMERFRGQDRDSETAAGCPESAGSLPKQS